jgi:hypothetical protein
MTRYLLSMVLGTNEVEELAFAARVGTVRVAIVDAG